MKRVIGFTTVPVELVTLAGSSKSPKSLGNLWIIVEPTCRKNCNQVQCHMFAVDHRILAPVGQLGKSANRIIEGDETIFTHNSSVCKFRQVQVLSVSSNVSKRRRHCYQNREASPCSSILIVAVDFNLYL
jgi:hypothetical protein